MKFNELNLHSIGNTINLVGAVYAGEGKMLLCLFPEDQGEVEVEQEHSHGECMGSAKAEFRSKDGEYLDIEALNMGTAEWEAFVRQTDLLETEVLTKASDGTLAKVILRKSTRQIDTALQWKVWKKAGYRCDYCGKDDVPLTVDHLVTYETGGATVEANLLSACKKCNKIRGNLPFEEWLRHPRYREMSKNLTPEVRAKNEALVATLDKIPRMVHTRSR